MWTYIYCYRCNGYIGCTSDLNFHTYADTHKCKEA